MLLYEINIVRNRADIEKDREVSVVAKSRDSGERYNLPFGSARAW